MVAVLELSAEKSRWVWHEVDDVLLTTNRTHTSEHGSLEST